MIIDLILLYGYCILILVNGCGQCPQFVHSREIFIIKMILIIQII